MIPFDFIYCKPDTPEEAYQAFTEFRNQNKNPMYYGGGSEIITMSRAGSIRPGAVIDIKQIPECGRLDTDCDGLNIGSACTLNQIKESGEFPLMRLVCGRIADHTNQCRITLGGNIRGTIMYRETSLPLLISDASVTILGDQGIRTLPFQDIFAQRMNIQPDELIVQVHIPKWALSAPHFHVKRTANEKIDYPLVTMTALKADNRWRTAFSGVCANPFRGIELEQVLNDDSIPIKQRAEMAAELLPEPVYQDAKASGEYRLFVLKNMLNTLLEDISNDKI